MSRNKFVNLPAPIKLLIVKDNGLSPFDLLALSHTCKRWRKCATDDRVFASWFHVSAFRTLSDLSEGVEISMTRRFGSQTNRCFRTT